MTAITVERFFAHPPAKIWRCLTEPELHARWWAPGDVRPVVGHVFELDMGKFGKQRCEVVVADAPTLLQYRFATASLDTLITWRLVLKDGGTLLQLTHDGFDDSPMSRAALEGMGAGWPRVVARIEPLLTEI